MPAPMLSLTTHPSAVAATPNRSTKVAAASKECSTATNAHAKNAVYKSIHADTNEKSTVGTAVAIPVVVTA